MPIVAAMAGVRCLDGVVGMGIVLHAGGGCCGLHGSAVPAMCAVRRRRLVADLLLVGHGVLAVRRGVFAAVDSDVLVVLDRLRSDARLVGGMCAIVRMEFAGWLVVVSIHGQYLVAVAGPRPGAAAMDNMARGTVPPLWRECYQPSAGAEGDGQDRP